MLCTDALAVPACLIFLSQELWKGSGLAWQQNQPVTTSVCLQLPPLVATLAVACLACPSLRAQSYTEFPGFPLALTVLASNATSHQTERAGGSSLPARTRDEVSPFAKCRGSATAWAGAEGSKHQAGLKGGRDLKARGIQPSGITCAEIHF